MGIVVKNLVKSFGPLTVIHAISFDVADGEFVTLLGPSGCGKTTTLRCIAGLDTPTSGTTTFSRADRLGMRLNAWNTTPTSCCR